MSQIGDLFMTREERVQVGSRAGERLLQAVGTNRCLSLMQSCLQGSAVAKGGAIDLTLSVVLPCARFATSHSKGPGQGNTCSNGSQKDSNSSLPTLVLFLRRFSWKHF